MRVPLLDLSEQYRALAEPIRAEIEQVLSSQRFILGPKVKEFEEAIARFCGVGGRGRLSFRRRHGYLDENFQ